MKDENGFLILASSIGVSIEELINRDEGAGPFIWVRPQDVSGVDAAEMLARNLKAKEKLNSSFEDEDIFPEAFVCSYLESCVRHRSAQAKIDVEDVIGACVYIMVKWGSSIPAHGFYGDLDLLSLDNASKILKIIRSVYQGLSNEVLRKNIRYFVSEHYRASGVWALSDASRFFGALDSEDLEFVSKLNFDEMNSILNSSNGNASM
ncbi:hypothetical protein [Variovorax sp. YR566]|uniref:hypothetical protein n=1 Tax=Variovorax sp. YR566 TaxID=3450237 RepID=UPI003F815444